MLASLEDFMKENLMESRYAHSLRVEQMAVRLAKIYGLDAGKAAFAGRYHDIAKNFDPERMDGCVRKYGLPSDLLGNNALAHSKVGAAILEHEFGVTDKDILDGIRYHTTGRRGMSGFEMLIFTADVVEDGRTYPDLEYYQQLAYKDIRRCCLEILEYTINDLTAKGRTIHKDTIEAYDDIRDRINTKEKI